VQGSHVPANIQKLKHILKNYHRLNFSNPTYNVLRLFYPDIEAVRLENNMVVHFLKYWSLRQSFVNCITRHFPNGFNDACLIMQDFTTTKSKTTVPPENTQNMLQTLQQQHSKL